MNPRFPTASDRRQRLRVLWLVAALWTAFVVAAGWWFAGRRGAQFMGAESSRPERPRPTVDPDAPASQALFHTARGLVSVAPPQPTPAADPVASGIPLPMAP